MELTRNYEKRHFFVSIAVIIAVSIPFAVPFFPFIISDVMYATRETWFIQTPKAAYFLWGAGFLLWLLATIIIYYFNVNKASLIVGIVMFILSFIPIVLGANHYKELSDDGVTFSEISTLDQKHYKWDEINKIVYHLEKEKGKRSILEFQFKDGNNVKLVRDSHLSNDYYKLREKISEYQIEFVNSKNSSD
ncbi:hypothetical protein E1I69_06590 [Bacillus timonensis]|uniref:Uncharacterized protein n=1 Tax=Bacillus timonensis TaxID=1033734 RepID=A0A4S3PV60_9BACI|nr:hypothetical protein [Bacillus timonensis]THE13578.1 hypothetical protein E1I69_06590 [Bacillus timonensis]